MNCNLNNSCVNSLCELIETNTSIHDLQFDGNSFSGDSYDKIINSLEKNKTITGVIMGDDETSDEQQEKLDEILERNEGYQTNGKKREKHIIFPLHYPPELIKAREERLERRDHRKPLTHEERMERKKSRKNRLDGKEERKPQHEERRKSRISLLKSVSPLDQPQLERKERRQSRISILQLKTPISSSSPTTEVEHEFRKRTRSRS